MIVVRLRTVVDRATVGLGPCAAVPAQGADEGVRVIRLWPRLFFGALAPLLAVLLLLSAASPALAATRTVTFDDLPANTALGSQYVPQGVEFRRSPSGTGQGNGFVQHRPQSARSAPNAVFMGCGVEVCPANVWAAFSAGHSTVTAFVGGYGTFAGGAQATMRMKAYDLAGNLVAQSSVSFSEGEPVAFRLAVSRAESDIRYVNLHDDAGLKNLWLDDLSFDVPDPQPIPSVPDFAVGRFGFDGFTLEPGRTATAALVVRRENGSAGPIALAPSGLPPGVSMDFAPNPTNGADGSMVQLTIRVSPDAPGSSSTPVTITATPASVAVGPAPRSFTIPVTVLRPVTGFDLRTKGIEVTQGVQGPGLLIPTFVQGPEGEYRGQRLVTDRRTIVRVYAEAIGAPAGGVPDAGMVLFGFDERTGRSLPEGPVMPIGVPARLGPTELPGVSPADRVTGRGAYTFVLPTGWARGSIRLAARVFEPPDPMFAGQVRYDECQEPACRANNEYTLRRIQFTPTRIYKLDVLELITKATAKGPLPPLEQVFSAPLAVMPSGEGRFQLRGPRAVITQRDDDLNKATQEWFDANPTTRGDAAMGVEWPESGGGGQAWGNTAIASGKRPFTALGHELFHLLGRPHASAACGGADVSKANEGDNKWDPWPPDERGLIQGVGFDRRNLYRADLSAIATGFPTAATEVFDLMSYCAPNNPDNNVWLSPRNWEATLDFLSPPPQLRAASSGGGHAGHHTRASAATAEFASGTTLAVTAELAPRGNRILSVTRVQGGGGVGAGNSPYRLVARSAAGVTIAEAAMVATNVHEPRATILSGSVPARGVASVAVVLAEQIIAERTATKTRPTLRLLSPAPGHPTRIAGTGSFPVRWRATDADGDPLVARVEHSRDGGRSWQQIASAGEGNTIAVPKELFARTANGRVRVIASDGFHESIGASALVRSEGRAPRVSIRDPRPRATVPADGTVTLTGNAQDDRFAELPPSRMTWYDGRHLLGRGTSLTISGRLAPGLRTLRLVARDQGGRAGTATVLLRVLPVTPRFLKVTPIGRLTRRSRTVKLRVQSTVAATLRSGNRLFAVDRKLRTVRIPVKPSGRPLVLVLRLKSGKLASAQTLTIARG